MEFLQTYFEGLSGFDITLFKLGNMAFELQVWNENRIDSRDALIGDLNFAIREKLLAHEITLA